MHVRVDEPGKNSRVTEVMNPIAGGHLIGRNNAADSLSLHQYRGRANSCRSHHSSSAESLQAQSVSSLEHFAKPAHDFGCTERMLRNQNCILRNSKSQHILASR